MRTTTPRIAPLAIEGASEEQAALLAPYRTERGVLNIYGTMANNPKAMRGFLAWGRYVLRESTFDARLRELAILRIGWLCKSGYEWTQHSRLAATLGVSQEEIERVKAGPEAAGWGEVETLVLRAADELHADYMIPDDIWAGLNAHLSQEHCMDLVFTVGHYTQVCMLLNAFGVQLEDGVTLDPALRG